MKNLIIIGASGFGREVAWLVERINSVSKLWNILGFIDDNIEIQGKDINGYKVIGKTTDVGKYPGTYFVCAVGASDVREKIVKFIREVSPNIKFGTLVDPSVQISDSVKIDEGTIICAHSIVTVNISIGAHVIINLDCTIGHDAEIQDYVTVYPSVNISGNAKVGRCSELGTGAQIIQGKSIGNNTIIGAGAVVINDIQGKCTAVGCPAAPVRFF